jgi:hypothetical protein
MAAQDFAREHPRQNDVVRKFRLAGTLRPRIDLAKRLADYVEWSIVAVLCHRLLAADERGFTLIKNLIPIH